MAVYAYREHVPAADRRDFIECFWSIETFATINTGVPPDGCVDIVFSPDFGLRAVGTMTVEQVFFLGAGTQTVGVRFRPGMAGSVLRVSPAEFTDSFIDLEDLWPQRGMEWKTQLLESKSIADQMEALCRSVQIPEQAKNPVQLAIKAMRSVHGNVDIDYIASQANLSSRQFRRRCREEAGLTPKHLCRILRFRRAQQLAKCSSRVNWAQIAAETGYFDQSHLIRDFGELTGRTPMSVFSNRRQSVFT